SRDVGKPGDRRVAAGAHLPVGPVDARRAHVHQQLSGTNDGVGKVAVLHHIGPAAFHEEGRLHEAILAGGAPFHLLRSKSAKPAGSSPPGTAAGATVASRSPGSTSCA